LRSSGRSFHPAFLADFGWQHKDTATSGVLVVNIKVAREAAIYNILVKLLMNFK
jgi:hypothetical protein